MAGAEDTIFECSRCETLLYSENQSTEDIDVLIEAAAKEDGYLSTIFIRQLIHFLTPLRFAVIHRKRRIVEALLQTQIDINYTSDSFGKTAMHDAVNNIDYLDVPFQAQVPDLWIIRKLLHHKHIKVDKKDVLGETALMQAVRDKHLEIVKLLLNHGSNINATNNYGETPLHIALSYEDPCLSIVVLLLLNRANLLKMSHDRETPLNTIFRQKSVHFASVCLKVIAFHYCLKRRLMIILFKNPELSQLLNRCDDEIQRMKGDMVANQMTVFDFFGKCALKSGFSNPISEIYKPIVEKLITGLYQEYFCYLLHRISKSNLSEVLKCVVEEKYCKKGCNDKNCKKEQPTAFSEVIRNDLIFDYLSSFDIFRLIATFSSVKISESILYISQHECYFTDS